MTMKPKYCSQCKVSLVPRMIGDRMRECCPSCGKIFYRNPIPVASAVVLNDKREVLLVHRVNAPQKGMWCLPIGFAELDETIEEAALRELQEEAVIRGTVKQLLDVCSQKSDFYGDLLIVTFEVGDIDGTPVAGDDADDAGWFSLDALPTLAFVANELAVRKCIALHQREWDQQASFSHLEDCADDRLLSFRLVRMVEQHSLQIANKWLAFVLSDSATRSYRSIQPALLQERASSALEHLNDWLLDDITHHEVGRFFKVLGGERGTAGMAPHELMMSLTFLRQTIFTFVRDVIDEADSVSTYAALELNQRIVHFFDTAVVESSKAMLQPSKL